MKNFIYLCATMVFCLWVFSKCTPSTPDNRYRSSNTKLNRDASQMGTAVGQSFTDTMNGLSGPK